MRVSLGLGNRPVRVESCRDGTSVARFAGILSALLLPCVAQAQGLLQQTSPQGLKSIRGTITLIINRGTPKSTHAAHGQLE